MERIGILKKLTRKCTFREFIFKRFIVVYNLNMNTTTTTLFDFIKFSSQLRAVMRHNYATSDRVESVAEHSWHLALMCWVLHKRFEEEFGVAISQEKMMKMCLMHDLVEIETGDISVWKLEERKNKSEREDVAAQKIFSKLPDGLAEEMLSLWHEFEKAETLESKIVRGVDRLSGVLMRLLTGQGWSDVGGEVQKIDQIQLPRIGFSEVLKSLYESIKKEALFKDLLKS